MDEDAVIGGISVFVALCLVLGFGVLSFDSSTVTARTEFDFGAVDGEAYAAPEMASFRAAVEEVSGLQALRDATKSSASMDPLSKALAGVIGDNYADRKRLVYSLGAGSELFEAKAKALREAERVKANTRFGALFLDGTKGVQARASVLSDRAAIAFGELRGGGKDCRALMASTGLSTPNAALLESIALRLSPGAWVENCEAGKGLSERGGVALSLSRVVVSGESPAEKVVRLSGSVIDEEAYFEDLTDYLPPVIVAANQIKQINSGGERVWEKVVLPGRARIDFDKISVLSGEGVSLSVSAKDALSPEGDYYRTVEGGATVFVSTRKLCEDGACRFLVTVSSVPPVVEEAA